MRNSIIFFSIVISVSILFYPKSTVSLSTGSPGGKTGSPSDNGNCMSCHSGSAGSINAIYTSNIPALGYTAGNVYTITAAIQSASTNGISGFEVTCEEDATGLKTGTFFTNSSFNGETQMVNNGTAVTHTASGNTLNSWSFDWEAPMSGTGQVTFYGAFIQAGYPVGNNSGDLFGAASITVDEFLPTGSVEVNRNNTRKLIRITDELGRESKINNFKPLFYIYNDGSFEKRIVLE